MYYKYKMHLIDEHKVITITDNVNGVIYLPMRQSNTSTDGQRRSGNNGRFQSIRC